MTLPADTSGAIDVAAADVVVSPLDGIDPVIEPPELCTVERVSGFGASPGEEVDPSWPSAELFTAPDDESDEEPAGEGDVFAGDLGPVEE